jgi:hypothetical protein
MGNNYDVLTALRNEWLRISHAPYSSLACQKIIDGHPDLALDGVHDLGDLVRVLEPRGGRSVEQRADIVRAMLIEATDLHIRRALLQTLLPGIVSTCRQLRWGNGIFADPSEVMGESVSMANELLTQWAGQARQYAAPDVLSALRGRLRRWMLKEKKSQCQILRFEPIDVVAREASPLLTRLESFRGGPHDRIATITYRRVFEGQSLKDLAALDRSSQRALQQELQHFALTFLL